MPNYFSLQNMNFDGLTFLTALVLYSQFALEVNLFRKLTVILGEFNGFFIIKQIEKP